MTQQDKRTNPQDPFPDEDDIPTYNGVTDFMGQLYTENKDQIHSNVGRWLLLSAKGAAVWFVISFLPIPYQRKRHVHHQIKHGQQVDWRYALFGRFSLVRAVIYMVVLLVVGYFLLQMG